MKKLSMILSSLSIFLISFLGGCSNQDSVSPTIHSVSVLDTVYVGESVRIQVDASDNKTKKE